MPRLDAFAGQRGGEVRLSGVEHRLDQRQADGVALRVAAAEVVRDGPDPAQKR